MALGTQARATGDRSIALGSKSKASGKKSAALGADSKATGFQSTAIGYGARARRDHEIAVGTRASSYRLRGLAPGGSFVGSKYQNSGDKRIVTTDDSGTLGTTDFSVDRLLDTVGATGALSAAIGSLPTTILLPDETFRCGIGTGVYSSQFAGSVGCAAKIKDRVFVNAGIAATTTSTILNGPMGRVGFSIGFGGSPSNDKKTELSQLPNTLASVQSGELISHFGDGSTKQVYSMRGDANTLSDDSEAKNFEIAMRSNIETLRLEAESKQDEIDRLKDKLDQLINQSEEAESEEMITHLKNQIKELVQQLALERQEAETKHDQQSETIQSLQDELRKQKEITQKIMLKLGMLSQEN